jgi:hypothetical protein
MEDVTVPRGLTPDWSQEKGVDVDGKCFSPGVRPARRHCIPFCGLGLLAQTL